MRLVIHVEFMKMWSKYKCSIPPAIYDLFIKATLDFNALLYVMYANAKLVMNLH